MTSSNQEIIVIDDSDSDQEGKPWLSGLQNLNISPSLKDNTIQQSIIHSRSTFIGPTYCRRSSSESSSLPSISDLATSFLTKTPLVEASQVLQSLTSTSFTITKSSKDSKPMEISDKTSNPKRYTPTVILTNEFRWIAVPEVEVVDEMQSETDTEDLPGYPPFGNYKPKFVEFTNIFPPFPKSHVDGFATVVELDDTMLNQTTVGKLRDTLQYSLRGGHGKRLCKNVEFFRIEDEEEVPMDFTYRQCAGVKVCQFLPDEMKIPHTEVDEEGGHTWAQLLAAQEQAGANSYTPQVEVMFAEYKDEICERPSIVNARKGCGGRSVIRSHDPKISSTSYNRLFIGCEKYRQRERGHTYIPLANYDPIAVLQIWGKERCFVHDDILSDLDFNWDNNQTDSIYYILRS